jgi:hypothetical protein
MPRARKTGETRQNTNGLLPLTENYKREAPQKWAIGGDFRDVMTVHPNPNPNLHD